MEVPLLNFDQVTFDFPLARSKVPESAPFRQSCNFVSDRAGNLGMIKTPAVGPGLLLAEPLQTRRDLLDLFADRGGMGGYPQEGR